MKKEIGHIYIVDLQAGEEAYCWMLCAILLHEQPFIYQQSDLSQRTSVATFKIKSPTLQNQILSIQNALMDGRQIYAEISFSQLKLLAESNEVPSAMAELIEFNHLVVAYRSGN